MTDILIKNADVFSGTKFELKHSCDILISNGCIKELGPELDAPKAELIEGRDFFITPGFVNAHFHPAQQLNRALGVGLSHDRQMDLLHSTDKIKKAEDRDLLAKIAVLEAVQGGTTTFYSVGSSIEGQVKLYDSLGVRAACALIPKDINADDKSKHVRAKVWNAEERIKYAKELYQKYSSELINVHFGVCNVRYASDKLITGMFELAEESNVGFHMHAAESDEYVNAVKERTGERPVEHLNSLGVLSPRVSMAHCVKLTEKEIEFIGANGASVVHCPRANSYVGVGTCPIPSLVKQGVNLALGSDAAINNNSNRVLGEAHALFDIISNVFGKVDLLSRIDLIKSLTINGAIALGFQDKIGSIEPGKQADLVLWNKNDLEFIPGHDYLVDLVFVDGCRAHTVFVEGKAILKNYRCTMFDDQELRTQARKISEKYRFAFNRLYMKCR